MLKFKKKKIKRERKFIPFIAHFNYFILDNKMVAWKNQIQSTCQRIAHAKYFQPIIKNTNCSPSHVFIWQIKVVKKETVFQIDVNNAPNFTSNIHFFFVFYFFNDMGRTNRISDLFFFLFSFFQKWRPECAIKRVSYSWQFFSPKTSFGKIHLVFFFYFSPPFFSLPFDFLGASNSFL